jgi:diaminopimelate epimerase
MVIGFIQNKLTSTVQVDLPGGSLQVRWSGEGHPVRMTGPAEHVFDGQVAL